MAIVSRSRSKHVADLIGYQSLKIGASQNCREGQWTIYDRRFCLKASVSHTKQWSIIDTTIWNMTFPDRAIKSHQPQGTIPPDLLTPNPSHQGVWSKQVRRNSHRRRNSHLRCTHLSSVHRSQFPAKKTLICLD